ncbi:MAG: hypothetical protein KF902_01315 [Phycisphaeraceae bacterium]|nr:hypothetical protein [Phycisphaeraceae bacterium]
MRHKALFLIGLSGLALSWSASDAHAQNALGDGRRLDRSLNTQSNYNAGNSRGAFYQRVQQGNAVVTGNAAGGRSFRGDVGYTGSSDFRGSLGSEDIFTFRRDASFAGGFNSGASRGLAGLQTQLNSTTGSGASQSTSGFTARDQGGLLVRRAGSGSMGTDIMGLDSSGSRRTSPRGIGSADVVDLRTDFSDTQSVGSSPQLGVGSLRSTSAYSTSQSFTPSLIGQRREQDGSVTSLTASSLRGVRSSTTGPDGQPLPVLTGSNNAAPRSATPGSPTTMVSTQAGLTNPASPRTAVAPAKTAYDALMDRYKEQTGTASAAGPAGDLENWQKQLEDIRATLEGSNDAASTLLTNLGAEGLPVDPTAQDPVRLYSQRTIDMILKQAGQTNELLLTAEGRLGAFGERMRRGERALAEGRYFDAEESFSTSLTLRPGDVAASIGRVHAQLGAGMYLSAALNLRMTLGANPAAVGERYGPALLPSAARCDEIIEELRANTRSEDRLGYESAVLLAYIGYQTSRREAMEEGFAAIERLASTTSRPIDSRFVELVRRVWRPLMDRSSTAPTRPAAPAEEAGGDPVGG